MRRCILLISFCLFVAQAHAESRAVNLQFRASDDSDDSFQHSDTKIRSDLLYEKAIQDALDAVYVVRDEQAPVRLSILKKTIRYSFRDRNRVPFTPDICSSAEVHFELTLESESIHERQSFEVKGTAECAYSISREHRVFRESAKKLNQAIRKLLKKVFV